MTSSGEEDAIRVAARLQRLHENALWERPIVVRAFACGTAGSWLWATFRLTPQFSGGEPASVRRGLVAEVAVGTSDDVADRLWAEHVARRADLPSDEGAVLRDGVWWREIALPIPHRKTLR